MKKDFDTKQVSRVLKSIANESRLIILSNLFEKPLSVNVLNKKIKISQSALSQHLNMLKLTNIVDSKRTGYHVIYFISNKEIMHIIALIKKLYSKEGYEYDSEKTDFTLHDPNLQKPK